MVVLIFASQYRMKKFYILLLLTGFCLEGIGQSTYVPYSRDMYRIIDRFQVKYGEAGNLLPTTFKPMRRSDLARFLKNIEGNYENFDRIEQFNFEFLMNDNWQWSDSKYNTNDKSWWNLFYKKKSDFYFYEDKGISVRINPLLDVSLGRDSGLDETLFTNTRGVELEGIIDDKIGFYTFLTNTQALFPSYVTNYVRTNKAFPNEGFWKNDADQFDLTQARGYFTFGLSQSIDIQAGYDKKFIGSGLRSMVLSDFSNPFLFGQINLRFNKFSYQIFYGELTSDIIFANSISPGDGNYPNKYFNFHRLGVNITPQLEVGVFEAIIAQSADISYFNPIIFYRAVEQQLGSPDNVLLGLDFQWNFKKQFQFYGQFILDEFVIDALRGGEGDWRNKFGVQLGAKYYDAFNIHQLDLQVEANLARPYIYASDTAVLSYTHYRNPLAHPLGANMKEIVFTAKYQPLPKLSIYAKVIRSQFGEDPNTSVSFGGDLLKSTDLRPSNLGNTIGQGLTTNNTYFELRGTYMLFHNVFLEWTNTYRDFQPVQGGVGSSPFITNIGLRWNIAKRHHEF